MRKLTVGGVKNNLNRFFGNRGDSLVGAMSLSRVGKRAKKHNSVAIGIRMLGNVNAHRLCRAHGMG